MGRYQIGVKFKMNTMDKDYSGTLPTDGLGGDNTMDNKDKDNPRLWWAGAVTSRFAGFCSSQPSGYTWDFPFSSSFVLSNFEVRGRVSLSIHQSSLFLYPTGSW